MCIGGGDDWIAPSTGFFLGIYQQVFETFQGELMLFLRGIRKHRAELAALIDNFHLVKT